MTTTPTTTTPTTTPPGRRADHLLGRARIAYVKAGGREQPGSESDVVEIDGTTTITLRNVNGVLAVYELRGDALKRMLTAGASIDELIEAAFSTPRDPRSPEYRAGARAAVALRVEGIPIKNLYAAGTAVEDAFYAGIGEGHAIWRRAVAAGAA